MGMGAVKKSSALALAVDLDEPYRIAAAVRDLYETMDNSFNFKAPSKAVEKLYFLPKNRKLP